MIPRGTDRSQRTDGQPPGSEPGEHAEDLRRRIQARGAGPGGVFASSGQKILSRGGGGAPSAVS